MIVIDTDTWAPNDRIERWREEFGRSVIRAEVVAQGERAHDFGVRMAMLQGPSLGSLTMRLRAIRKVRDRAWFGDGADDLTFMVCLAGAVRFESNGVRRILRRGEMTLFSHVVPVELEWDDARIATVQVPRAQLTTYIDPERLVGQVLGRKSAAGAMLSVYLAELWRQGNALTPRAERHLLDLITEGLTGTGLADRPPGTRAAPRLAAARALIRAHAQDDLRVEQLAAWLGVSARTIERDFAADGMTFADELASARLDVAMTQLGSDRRISEIAYAAGFNDLSSFNRRFKARFGITPTEERAVRKAIR